MNGIEVVNFSDCLNFVVVVVWFEGKVVKELDKICDGFVVV